MPLTVVGNLVVESNELRAKTNNGVVNVDSHGELQDIPTALQVRTALRGLAVHCVLCWRELLTYSQDVLNSRIDRLQASQQMALKVASVIGMTFSKQVLAAVYPIEAEKPNLKVTL